MKKEFGKYIPRNVREETNLSFDSGDKTGEAMACNKHIKTVFSQQNLRSTI